MSAAYVVSPSQLVEVLTAVLPAKQPVMLLGPPGCGKTSLVGQVASNLGVEFRPIVVPLFDSVDLRGIPSVINGKTTWCQPDFLPSSGSGILLLNELPQAPPLVQNAFFPLMLERRIGDYRLPDGWVVMADGNRVEDRAGAGRTGTALNNRFMHLDLEISCEDWQAWAVTAGIAPEIRSFLRYRPDMLFQFNPATNPRVFATPRSWEAADRVYKAVPSHLAHKAVAGCVDTGPATEFIAYTKFYQQLPDLDAVLANPSAHPLPSKEPAVMFALIGGLVEKCKVNKGLAGAFATVGMRLPNEFGVLALRDALAMDKKLVANATVQQWVANARKQGLIVAA